MSNEALARIDADLARRVDAYLDSSVTAPTSRALIPDLLAALIPETPTDDEREALTRRMLIIAFGYNQQQAGWHQQQSTELWRRTLASAEELMASPEWRNRHRGPITDDPRALGYALDDLDDGADFQDAISPYSIRLVVKAMRAALEAAEAAR